MRRQQILLVLAAAVLLLGAAAWLWQRKAVALQRRYDPIIVPIAARLGVDPLLVRAIIWRESRFDPRARGLKEERGLMQVTPGVAAEWAQIHRLSPIDPDLLYEPAVNIAIGSWYFARMLHHWNGADRPEAFALAEYNAGRSNVLRWVDPAKPLDAGAMEPRITYKATRRYVDTILSRYAEYRSGYFRPPWLSFWDRLFRPSDAPVLAPPAAS
ncbi:MAG: lytic transglycosylase domain-containing protein [Verrucomicrobium sp.]|nr:lytic transglycosylase domain-containing protein [Verrucomicrobium sp.]